MKWALLVLTAGCFAKPPRPEAKPSDANADVATDLAIDTRTITGRHWVHPAYTPGDNVASPAIVYDPDHHQVLVYGGEMIQGSWYNDGLYRLDATGWHVVCQPCMPGARDGAGFAYDAKRHVAVLVGGYGETAPSTFDYMDPHLWEWDGTTWTQSTVALPTARTNVQAVWDPVRQSIVLIGGYDNTMSFASTYAYDGSSLVALGDTPDVVDDGVYQAVYDVANQRVLAAGGRGAVVSTSGDSLFALPSTAVLWQTLCGTCGAPRSEQNIVYDPLQATASMFGGFVDNGPIVDGTWQLATDHWTMIDAQPPGRNGAATVYDASRDVIVRYGGYNGDGSCPGNGDCNDTWEMVPN